jgi:hypothetical protein
MLTSEPSTLPSNNKRPSGTPSLAPNAQQPNFYTCPIGNSKPSASLSFPQASLPQVPVLRINDVAIQFGKQYYTMLSRGTDRVHFFYKDQSSSQHGVEGDQEVPLCFGPEKIHHMINSQGYSGCRVFISNIDCQPSINGGIIVMTVGKIQMKNGSIKSFVQTVFLAEQPSGYYILNDMFRFINNSSEDPVPVVEKSLLSSNQVEESILKQSSESLLSTDHLSSPPSILKNETPLADKNSLGKPGPICPPRSTVVSVVEKKEETKFNSWASLAAVKEGNKWDSGITVPEVPTIASDDFKPIESVNKNEDMKKQSFFTKNGPNFQQKEWKPFNPSCSIYIGGLKMDPKPSELVIREIFTPYGEIKAVDWGKDCAYVEFFAQETSQKLHNKIVNVCGIDVKILPRRYIQPGQRHYYRQNQNNSQKHSNRT